MKLANNDIAAGSIATLIGENAAGEGVQQSVPALLSSRLAVRAPTAFASLLRWYSASAITGVASGTSTPTLPDLSPAASHTTSPSAGNQPVYRPGILGGQPGLIFDGTSSVLNFARLTNVKTMIVVMRFDADQPSAQKYVTLLGDSTLADFAGANAAVTPALVEHTVIPTPKKSADMWINGERAGSLGAMVKHTGLTIYAYRVPDTETLAFSNIGQDRAASNRRTAGVYGDVALFSERLSDLDFASVQQYFLEKYRIQRGQKSASTAQFHFAVVGDSIAAGQSATVKWTERFMAPFGGSTRVSLHNVALGGSTVASWLNNTWRDQMQLLNNFEHLNSALPQIIYCGVGSNDLMTGVTPAVVYANLRRFWALCRATGARLIVQTILPRSDGLGVSGAAFYTVAAQLNDMIRSDPSQYDELVDLAASELIGYDGAEVPTTYYGDKCHLNDAGQVIQGDMAYASVMRLPEFGGRYQKRSLRRLAAAGTIDLPAGAVLDCVVARNLTANAVTGGIKIGTSLGGAGIVSGQAVGASAVVDLPASSLLARRLSGSSRNTLYIDAVTAWNSAVLDVDVWFRL